MKILLSIAILSLISVYMCEKNDSISTETILGDWEVVSIIVDATQINQESDSDIIVIEFQSDGRLFGNSSRNMLTGRYELHQNDSIWISSIGGTEALGTKWEQSFKSVVQVVSRVRIMENSNLQLLSVNGKNKIEFKTTDQ
ncbi:MAG: META domain-containing protein [Bacteroidales bacterium]